MKRLLAAVLALFCLANVARVILAVQQANQLPDLPTDLPPAYLAVMSAIWAVAFGVCAAGILRSRRWAPRATIAVIVLYQANLWLNHFAFTRSAEAIERTGYAALLSVISIIAIGSISLLCQWQFSRSACSDD
jgi:hypothetical protein